METNAQENLFRTEIVKCPSPSDDELCTVFCELNRMRTLNSQSFQIPWSFLIYLGFRVFEKEMIFVKSTFERKLNVDVAL